MTLSVNAEPPSIRGLRIAVGGNERVETFPGCISSKISWSISTYGSLTTGSNYTTYPAAPHPGEGLPCSKLTDFLISATNLKCRKNINHPIHRLSYPGKAAHRASSKPFSLLIQFLLKIKKLSRNLNNHQKSNPGSTIKSTFFDVIKISNKNIMEQKWTFCTI